MWRVNAFTPSVVLHNITCWLALCISTSVCTGIFAESNELPPTEHVFVSRWVLELAALPHTVTHLCLIRVNSQENTVEPALLDSGAPTTSPSLARSLIHFLTHVALPRHQSPLPALPTAYYNLGGWAPSRLPASNNMCVGKIVRVAGRGKGNKIATWAGASPYLKPMKWKTMLG